MDRNDRILLIAAAIAATTFLLTWAIVAGAFAAPANAGWVYNYQTLLGVAAALVGAYFTVAMVRREQRQQRDHFARPPPGLARDGAPYPNTPGRYGGSTGECHTRRRWLQGSRNAL